MKTKQTNYLSQVFLLLLLAFTFLNCTVDGIEEELIEENTIEESARKMQNNPCDCTESGGTDNESDDNDLDNDDNGGGDIDGDGDPDITDPDPNNPCIFTPGSPGNPFVDCGSGDDDTDDFN